MSAPASPTNLEQMGRKNCDWLGFPVNKDNGCPLFAIEPTVNNVRDLLAIVKRVTQNPVVETSCWFESGQGTTSSFADGRVCRRAARALRPCAQAMTCQSCPGLNEPAALPEMKFMPFMNQIAGVPSSLCHRMSDFSSPL
jgi:hypothetical protein